MQRKPLRDVFIPGIKSAIPDINEVIEGNQEAPKPNRPFISFTFNYQGPAPYERKRKGLQKRDVVSSSDPSWNKDVEKDYSKDVLLGVEFHIKDLVTGKSSVYLQEIESYFVNQFEDEVRDDGNIDSVRLFEVPPSPPQFGPREGTATMEATSVKEVILGVSQDYLETIPTIETLNIDPNSDLAADESYSL